MSNSLDTARFRRDHRWAPDHMSDYLDGELAASGRDRMRRHLSECEQCRRLLAGLRAVLEGLHHLPAPSGGTDALRIATAVRLRLRDD
jgi:anti-sigma factor RsiW